MLDKTFDPKKIDNKNYEIEEKIGIFNSDVNSSKDCFCIMMPPPNVTGVLHMGHALNFTLQDIIVRYKRLNGFNVLWQPGTDHAGIATQIVVEKELKKTNKTRHSLGKENFINKIWEWKNKSGNEIVSQMRQLGVSADWSRERFTMDKDLSETVKKVFIDLFEKKMIFKEKRLINWDIKLQTAVSDLEVENKNVSGFLYYINYPLKNNKNNHITIATTRPETMLGDSGVAVHPNDKRFKRFHGDKVLLPIINKEIPLVLDEHADPEKGSGVVKITPAHDFNDFEVGLRHKLELINIFDNEGKLNKNTPKEYQGLDRLKAREKILESLKKEGLLEKKEKYEHTIPYGDRSGEILEPFLTDQWFVDAKKLSKEAIKIVKEKKISFLPKTWEKTYFEWLENIQPWCISRQIWWGHKIPIWYGPDKKAFAAMDENDALKKAEKFYKKKVKLVQDQDVLDTWFSSSLWPFSTLGWPNETKEYKKYYPTDLLITGFDIIFFWVARMIMMGLFFTKKPPFKEVYIHALIRDEKGQKMSKSKGNVIDPLELTKKYGSDALRFTLSSLASPGRDIKLSTQKVESSRNFATKIWNASRYILLNDCKINNSFDPKKINNVLNKWILHSLIVLKDNITKKIEEYKFNEASNDLYHFIWGTFCDWYLEFTKPILQGSDKKLIEETKNTIIWTLDNILIMLYPFMPFLSRELRSQIHKNELEYNWPDYKNLKKSDDAKKEIDWIVNLISHIRTVRTSVRIPAKAVLNLSFIDLDKDKEKIIKKYNLFFVRLARVEIKEAKTENILQFVCDKKTFFLDVANVIDLKDEEKRIVDQIEKIKIEINKINKMLENSDFIKNAPDEVIKKQKEIFMNYKKTLIKLEEAKNNISKN
ncbi:MAG: Valine--tRNA ligase [Alphaproteobacteria bacterium MarineAlpha6_Bin3]|nr:MAG: Valine--tRNA ligase [Alphaproteobacteria bacterium MarineAlpha6_Bin3]|tara:strand:- start:408 stop:3035 length:2628 start_codon:yes stop_codon:yes gene_type:complete